MRRRSARLAFVLVSLVTASGRAEPAVHLVQPYDFSPILQGAPVAFEARLTGVDCGAAGLRVVFASHRQGTLGEVAVDAGCVAAFTYRGQLEMDPHDVTVSVALGEGSLVDQGHLTVYPPPADSFYDVPSARRGLPLALHVADPATVAEAPAFYRYGLSRHSNGGEDARNACLDKEVYEPISVAVGPGNGYRAAISVLRDYRFDLGLAP